MGKGEIDFSDIAPYEASQFKDKIRSLVKEPGFLHAVSYTMPKEDVPVLIEELLKITNTHDFQQEVMLPFLEVIAKTTTSGISLGV